MPRLACAASPRASTRTAGWSFFLSANHPGNGQPGELIGPPESARAVFGPALPLAIRYAGLLTGPGVRSGVIGPAEAGRIWERHLLNCAVVAELVPARSKVADLGSGAGLPGVVLAMMLPEAQVVLIEPMARRTAFLMECVTELELRNVRVERGRAEELAGRVEADVVTARAVAALDRLARLAAGLARPGGLVLAIKGESAAEEIIRAHAATERLGISEPEIVSAGSAVLERPTTVVRFRTSASGMGAVRDGCEPGGGVSRESRLG